MNRAVGAALAAAVVLAGGACSSGGGDDEPAPAATTTTTTATSSTAGPTTTATAEAIAVVLGPGRLLVGGNALVFGAPGSQVEAYLDRALGDATDDRTQQCDAGQLRSIRWPGVTAYVSPDTGFAGWSAEDATTFRTAKGIGLGSSTDEVRTAYPDVEINPSTLGTEGFVPDDADDDDAGLSLLLDDATGKVAALWSGATCVAR